MGRNDRNARAGGIEKETSEFFGIGPLNDQCGSKLLSLLVIVSDAVVVNFGEE